MSKKHQEQLPADHDLTYEQMLELADDLKTRGYSETSIAHTLRLNIPEFRALKVIRREAQGESMPRDEITRTIQNRDLAVNAEFQIEGPWGHKNLEGFETDVYIFQQGTGAKLKIGKVVAKIEKGLRFEVELDEEYKDLDVASSFEVPMRFYIRRK